MKPFSILHPNQAAWPKSYGLHPNHCRDVLEGSYNVPYDPATPPTVIDLGSNVGAFTRWAVERWPGCVIHAYEPCPSNFKLLEKTAAQIAIDLSEMPDIFIYQQAVAGHACRATLQAGEFNCGEWSLMMPPVKGRETVEVDVIAATDLPRADVLKIDTEGCELLILATLDHAKRLPQFSAIMLETHSDEHVPIIKANLARAGFTLTGEAHPHLNRAELKFVRNDVPPTDFKL
jgi:FkbM family methyltransferase